MNKVTTQLRSAVRGSLLGLLVGDSIGATNGHPSTCGTLAATSAGQLACFTVDGTIRAHVRASHKGMCHPPSVVWHAYTRWAALQGIPGVEKHGGDSWPDGWLAQVPALAVRRGSAPATVAALQGQAMGRVGAPVSTSLGAHSLTRTLPAGMAAPWLSEPIQFARDIAATTHAIAAVDVAALGATIIANLVTGQPFDRSVQLAQDQCVDQVPEAVISPLPDALAAAASNPGDRAVLRRLAPDAKASSALAGAIYVTAAFPERAQVREALFFAASADEGGHVAATAGAFLGAAHGFAALPVDWVSRLELAWVADVLAQDLVSEFVEGPSGSEYAPSPDRTWWNRYPGW